MIFLHNENKNIKLFIILLSEKITFIQLMDPTLESDNN